MSGRTRTRRTGDNSTQKTKPVSESPPAANQELQIHPPEQPRKRRRPEIEKKKETFKIDDEEENVEKKEEEEEAEKKVEEKKEEKEIEEKKEIPEKVENSPEEQQEPEFTVNTFHVKRIKSMLGVSKFDFSINGEVKMFGEYKHSMFGTSSVDICNAGTQTVVATMEISDSNTHFVVHKGDKTIASFNIVRPGGNAGLPRAWIGTITSEDGKERQLRSKAPEVNADGKYVLFFGGKILIASVKNCILIDKAENFEVVGVRKIEKNTLEIDARSDYTPLEVFIIGTASFLAD